MTLLRNRVDKRWSVSPIKRAVGALPATFSGGKSATPSAVQFLRQATFVSALLASLGATARSAETHSHGDSVEE